MFAAGIRMIDAIAIGKSALASWNVSGIRCLLPSDLLIY